MARHGPRQRTGAREVSKMTLKEALALRLPNGTRLGDASPDELKAEAARLAMVAEAIKNGTPERAKAQQGLDELTTTRGRQRRTSAGKIRPQIRRRLGSRPVNHDPDCKLNQGDHAQEQVCRRQRDENRAQPQKLVQDGQHDRCHRERPKNYLLSQERQSSERKIK